VLVHNLCYSDLEKYITKLLIGFSEPVCLVHYINMNILIMSYVLQVLMNPH
jgi:hypothetical protein